MSTRQLCTLVVSRKSTLLVEEIHSLAGQLSCVGTRRTLLLEIEARADSSLCRPSREHTEIEEELHEKANIDYDRVAIVWFPDPCDGHLLAAHGCSDFQSVRCRTLRRCPRVRDRFSHHLHGCLDGLFRGKDRPITVGQTYREGGQLFVGNLVGSCQ